MPVRLLGLLPITASHSCCETSVGDIRKSATIPSFCASVEQADSVIIAAIITTCFIILQSSFSYLSVVLSLGYFLNIFSAFSYRIISLKGARSDSVVRYCFILARLWVSTCGAM